MTVIGCLTSEWKQTNPLNKDSKPYTLNYSNTRRIFITYILLRVRLPRTPKLSKTQRMFSTTYLCWLDVKRLPCPGAVVHDPHGSLVGGRDRDDEAAGDLRHVRLATLVLFLLFCFVAETNHVS